MNTGEALPTCIDTEMALIGAFLLRNEDLAAVEHLKLTSGHFADPALQTLFEAITCMVEGGERANPVTLTPYLGGLKMPAGDTPMAFMARLGAGACNRRDVESYAKQVVGFHARRQMILTARSMIDDALDAGPGMNLQDVLRSCEDRIESLRPRIGGKRTGFRSMSQVADSAIRKIQDDWNDKTPRRTLRTGFDRLDEKLGGLAAPDLIIIGGRPASGKTALVVDMLVNTAMQLVELYQDAAERGCVAAFSLEMSEQQLSERVFAREARVSGTRIRKRSLAASEVEDLVDAARAVMRLPIEIDETGGLGIAQILARARALNRRKRIRLLAIDYLQLIKPFRQRSNESRRHEELGEMTSALKELAKELECPVLLLSQLGRDVENRIPPRPKASDLKESGSIEQDADAILLLYREETYVWRERPREGTEAFVEWEQKFDRVKGIAEVIIDKSRFGGQGVVTLGYDGPRTTFLQEPEPRDTRPPPPRAKASGEAKPVKPTPAGMHLETVLKELTLSASRKPTKDDLEFAPKLPRGAQLIEVEAAMTAFANAVNPEASQAQQKNEWNKGVNNLQYRDITSRYEDMNGVKYIFLHRLIAE